MSTYEMRANLVDDGAQREVKEGQRERVYFELKVRGKFPEGLDREFQVTKAFRREAH